jgi:hypothetical protein
LENSGHGVCGIGDIFCSLDEAFNLSCFISSILTNSKKIEMRKTEFLKTNFLENKSDHNK